MKLIHTENHFMCKFYIHKPDCCLGNSSFKKFSSESSMHDSVNVKEKVVKQLIVRVVMEENFLSNS